MKVWIGHNNKVYVDVFARKPKAERWRIEDEYWAESNTLSELHRPSCVCRPVMAQLLRGTGKKLPRLDTNELVEVEIFAK